MLYLVTINFIEYKNAIATTSDAVNTLNKNKIFSVVFEKAFIHWALFI